MTELLRAHPAFRRLWLAGAISLVGDWLSFVAVSIVAAKGGHGALGLALVLAAHSLPGALVSPLAGAVADRFDRRKLLMAAALTQATLTLAMTLAAAKSSMWALQSLLLLRAAVASVVPPAESAALPSLVSERHLLPANALVASTWSVAYVAGMALGGALAMVGPTLAIGLDALSFVIAAILLSTLPPLPAESGGASFKRVMTMLPRDVANASRLALGDGALFRVVFRKTPIALAGGAAWLSLNLLAAAQQPFGSAALGLGILQAARGIGTGVGPQLATWSVRRGWSESRVAAFADATAFAGMAAFVLVRSPWALLLAALAWGSGSGANWVMSSSAMQKLGPREYLGRLFSIDELSVTVAMVASALLAAAAVEAGASRALVVLAGALAGIMATIYLIYLSGARGPAAEPASAPASNA